MDVNNVLHNWSVYYYWLRPSHRDKKVMGSNPGKVLILKNKTVGIGRPVKKTRPSQMPLSTQ